MSNVKILEIELEEKLKKLEKDGDGEEGSKGDWFKHILRINGYNEF